MKNIIIIFLLSLCQLAAIGQVRIGANRDYNPVNPADPQVPVETFKLGTLVVPASAGTTNHGTVKEYAAATSVYLRAYNNNGYKFVNWTDGDSVVSTSSSFYYAMPATHTTLRANFVYAPSSPADPDSLALSYDLTVKAQPVNGGSFNTTFATVNEGASTRLYAYTNTGYVFKGWMIGDSLLSSASPFYYTMGNKDVEITGLFEYNPENPTNPGRNYWNENTGEVIVDDFTAGRLSSAISTAVSNSSSSDITMITVAGKMTSNDFSIANNYTNCSLLDLSRSYGYSTVPSYAYDYNTSLTKIILPAVVESIEYRAFYQCSNLAEVVCYSVTPPTVGNNAFDGIADGAVLRVLSSSISLYSEADGWKNFVILPLDEDVHSLSVALPDGSEDGRYKNMTLELVNADNGQRQKYVISDRISYTFNGLLKKSRFNVYVKNSVGAVLGKIEGVEIADDDVSVAFDTLLKPQNMVLQLLTPDAEDVTSQAQITWLSADGTYIKQGNTLDGFTEGTNVTFRVSLPQSLAMQYVLPADSLYCITADDNNISIILNTFSPVKFIGSVTDTTTGVAVSGATVSVTQMLNGKYSKAFNTVTDRSGAFSLTAFEAPSTMTFSANDYVSVTRELASLTDTTDVGVVALKPITGARITTSFTYTPAVAVDETAESQSFYSDYNNISYSIYNETRKCEITQFNVQYPQIVLLEEVSEGDILKLTATSRTNSFVPVYATATIDANNCAAATFDILQLGSIKASFSSTDNSSVVAILYNAKGEFVKRYNYTSAAISIDELQDGNYTLVSMGASNLFSSIYNLSQFAAAGLKEGIDYVKNAVEVKSGVVSTVNNDIIPLFDESKLYYTGDKTSFTVNKSSIVAGNYLTLKGQLDFKSVYSSKVSDVSIVIDLPESASFVENSVMVGSKISSYTIENNRVIVPLGSKYTEQVRFCVIPTEGGNYAPNAFARFTVDGNEVLQPIGSANYSVKDLSISVPSTVAKTTIPVSGTAIGGSTIQIFDNDVLIGETASLSNGVWSTNCELNEPYNLSRHQIYAKVITKQGLELQTEIQECQYDMNAIEVKTVTMINISHRVGSYYEEKTIFDFQNPPKSIPAYWYWPDYPEFTFLIDFTNNDTTKVSDVILYVETTKGNSIPLKAAYDGKKGMWVASGDFGNWSNYDIPVNVSLDYQCITTPSIDVNELVAPLVLHNDIQKEFIEECSYIETVFATKNQELIDSYMGNIGFSDAYFLKYIDVDSLESLFDSMSIEDLEKYVAEFFTETTKTDSVSQIIDGLTESFAYDENWNEISLGDITIKRALIQSVDSLQFVSEGFEAFQCSDNSLVYIKQTNKNWEIVDVNQGLRYTFVYKITEEANLIRRSNGERIFTAEKLREWTKSLEEGLEIVEDLFDSLRKTLDDILVPLVKQQSDLGRQKGTLVILKKKCDPAMLYIYNQKIQDIDKKLALLRNGIRAVKKVVKAVQKYMPVAKYAMVVSDATIDLGKLYGLYVSIPKPCEEDQINATNYEWDIFQKAGYTFSYYMGYVAFDVSATVSSVTQAAAGLVSGGSTVATGIITMLAKMGAEALADYVKERLLSSYIKDMDKKIGDLECYKKPCIGENCPQKNPNNNSGEYKSNNPNVVGVHDPSGYVYEGVSSNRVEGVMASCYYKETVEDMYGDMHENIVLWDATEYAQENPLFTDENGFYRWDVPQGLWQVKFEKEGYQTAYSEWLPVPPPQLEVNVAITQNRQPEVVAARAYEDGIEVEFDKYMLPDLLNTEHIFVTKNGETVAGEVVLQNVEAATEGSAVEYASKLRFVPQTSFLATDEVQLTVSRKVKSYAGIQMENDYTQLFDIEKEIKSLVVDSLVNVPYGYMKKVTVSALPYDAAIGKSLVVKAASSFIVSLSADTLQFDDNGQAVVEVTGELPGMSALQLSVVDAAVQASATVQVGDFELDITAAPTASRVSGTELYRNSTVELMCETEGAVIYYTVDGSCPCVDDNRFVYDSPIVITNDSVTIKAMAVADGFYESDVVEFSYSIKKNTLGISLAEGWNWVSHNMEAAVPVASLAQNTETVVSQANITPDSLNTTETYKIKVSENTEYTLTGYARNVSLPIALNAGKNWLGYPSNQVMSVSEAFANTTPDDGDCVVGQDGFALYYNGEWQGTLLTMTPGVGYMYYSVSNKDIVYNASLVSKAASLYSSAILNSAPWVADKHKYPNVMPVVAEISFTGVDIASEDYSVAAFCGDECRGVATRVDDVLMMNVYGEGSEQISFRVADGDGEQYAISETLLFNDSIVGTIVEPFKLNIGGELTRVSSPVVSYDVFVNNGVLYVVTDALVDILSLTDARGNVVVRQKNIVGNDGVDITHLADGVYIVTVEQGESVYYKKIILRNN